MDCQLYNEEGDELGEAEPVNSETGVDDVLDQATRYCARTSRCRDVICTFDLNGSQGTYETGGAAIGDSSFLSLHEALESDAAREACRSYQRLNVGLYWDRSDSFSDILHAQTTTFTRQCDCNGIDDNGIDDNGIDDNGIDDNGTVDRRFLHAAAVACIDGTTMFDCERDSYWCPRIEAELTEVDGGHSAGKVSIDPSRTDMVSTDDSFLESGYLIGCDNTRPNAPSGLFGSLMEAAAAVCSTAGVALSCTRDKCRGMESDFRDEYVIECSFAAPAIPRPAVQRP